MTSVVEVANELADEWLAMFLGLSWQDHADAIKRRLPRPCGETTSIETSFGLLDVSDSECWVSIPGGDIRLTIEVYHDPEAPPLASRSAVIAKDRYGDPATSEAARRR